ncbi:branched-chain amino acid transport system permease protein [Caldicellulosiruptor bescii]|uniref:Inner-membrane translocator n=1 Tax=Caldicellulosiruptor bescii (strain ATCC BAA-1888 / DSM 6725 / KCTC 15123 / Z-1320) TaxID=521460 RepID=B9MS33_CALBD|nr:branched-chain amino acid ABC transporter permease [Caldicellulosiruptor bescii]ACM60487.1 inner-membrane translocator [Caldicellulosiruptor bescii DSM 6725]PBC87900.1 branched-chain amino acid transport system permease protein [Caldicellulosiruptor bescii]PBC90832.1 branched-chain amino acid transport system permease protein [Caldicellulosiruptor bescii]PBD03736.1 branched-chain amino acid transport system permease protein [Caldicellulosiruptor bescii]PBD06630.1 branched-chain amino acid t
MSTFMQQLINGITLGSIYALISLGYTMVYGIIKLINFAHGDIFMVGAYIAYLSVTYLKLGLIPSLIVSMIFCSILGMLIEKFAYKPLRNSPRISALITAIGVSLLLENLMQIIMGADSRVFPRLVAEKNYHLFQGRIVVNNKQIYLLIITVLLMIILNFVVKKTKIGKAMRAVSQDMDAARLMGINVDTTISYTFAIGSALAAAAGVLVGLYYNTINPLMGVLPGLKAFIAAVFGGIGIIPGAMLGGFSLGIIETLVSGYSSSMYKDAVAFALLILILIIKPSGLLGKNIKEKV